MCDVVSKCQQMCAVSTQTQEHSLFVNRPYSQQKKNKEKKMKMLPIEINTIKTVIYFSRTDMKSATESAF